MYFKKIALDIFFHFFYYLLWLLALVLLAPIYLYRMLVQGKYHASTVARLGFQKIPNFNGKTVIWLHSVSLGESQIADQFAKELKNSSPGIIIVASSCTETGQTILSKSLHVDFCFYYPIDLGFLIHGLFERLKPKAIFIIETDLWPNMLGQAQKRSIPTFLLNAKISENTFSNYQKIPLLSSRLLAPIDHLFVQCQSYDSRFEHLGVEAERKTLTGNIKLDRQYPLKTSEEMARYAESLGLNCNEPIVIFGSSHEGEEQGFINVFKFLKKEIENLQVIFVPRHPERFSEVEQLLTRSGLSFNKFSEIGSIDESKSCLLVDKMGVLMDLYAISSIAVVAGSFTSKVGGHNIFEPAFFGKPIVYGPWIFKQPGLHDLIQEHDGAIQITNKIWENPLTIELHKLLEDEERCNALGQAALSIVNNSQGIGERVIKKLKEQHANILLDGSV